MDDKYKTELQKKDRLEAAIDVMLVSILRTALHALQIDLRYISSEKWKSKQELKRYVESNQIEYVPSTRFNRCIEKVLPLNKKFSLEYPENFLVDFADRSSIKNIDSFFIKQTFDPQNETINIVHDNIIKNEMYEVDMYHIFFVSELEKKP